MNDLISKFADESDMTQYVAANNKFLERFAVLIVRECARFVYAAEPNGLALDLLEHFGVKK